VTFFMQSAPMPEEEGQSDSQAAVNTVQKLESDITALKAELALPFYKDLRVYDWTPDETVSGKANPFLQ